jgi:hypothetical protein
MSDIPDRPPPGFWWKIANEFLSDPRSIRELAWRIYREVLKDREHR